MLKDYYYTPIKVGSPVAFNYSGYVRLGVVKEIRNVKDREYADCKRNEFIIQHADSADMTSKIKNTGGIVVLPFPITPAQSFPTHD